MPRPKSVKPAHCHHKASGRGFVKLNGHRKYTGKWGTQAADDKYDRLIGEWIARNRCSAPATATEKPGGATVTNLLAMYWPYCVTKFTRADGTQRGELSNIRDALRPLRRLYGTFPAADFGPDQLDVVRQEMIRAGNCRNYINRNTGRIVAVFKWAMLKKHVPVTTHHALSCVPQLAPGDHGVRETEEVAPAPIGHVTAVLGLLPGPVAAMVRLQLLTAARPGELRLLRTRDIDMTNPDLWEAHLKEHKMAHKKKPRALFFNAEAQKYLRPYLKLDQEAYCFSPADALAERHRAQRERRKTKVQPSQVRRAKLALHRSRSRPPKDHYTKNSYARAIVRACEVALGMPKELRKAPKNETAEAKRARLAAAAAWRAKYAWSPGQLRHNAATSLEAMYGLEKTSRVLGHATVKTTRRYAQQTFDVAREIMRGISQKPGPGHPAKGRRAAGGGAG